MRNRALLVAVLGIALAACSSSAQMTSPRAAADLVYVCNQGEATVSVIDTATNELVETVDLQSLGFSATAKPHHVVVEPDGSFWYLSMIGENRVLKFDRENRIVASGAFEVPGMLALHPDGKTLFVGRSMSAVNPPQSIGLIDRTDMSVDEIEVFFPRPHALAISADGKTVFSASLAENRMIAIDLDSGDGEFSQLEGPIHTLVQFAASPDGRTLIAGAQMTGQLFLLDVTDLPRITVRETLGVPAQPWHPVFGADGRHAYFGNKLANEITVVDVTAGEVTAVISGDEIAQPHGSAISADGRYVYISNQHTGPGGMNMAMSMDGDHVHKGTVTVVDTETNEIVKVIEVGMMPSGVGSRGPRR